MKLLRWPLLAIGLLLWLVTAPVQAMDARQAEQQWEALLEVEKKHRQAHLETLVEQTEKWAAAEPDNAAAFVWQGTALESLAREVGGFTGLRYAKQARTALEQALVLDPQGYEGMAQIRLGLLYERAPGWPVAFGSLKQAEEQFLAALDIRPDGVDTNFFYAAYLNFLGSNKKAMEYAKRAIEATPRAGFEAFDASLQVQAKDMVGDKEDE